MAVDGLGHAGQNIITSGSVADCKQASQRVVEGIGDQNLLSDKGYDTNQIVDETRKNNIKSWYKGTR
ncbi:hypothetical protein [Holospora elegans]|uniref:hypothetical protein n=1 Tax=Holospora elegans TaxID=431043 RepID=UPI000A03F193|nr:hypothetical protein [Holospora elegans]